MIDKIIQIDGDYWPAHIQQEYIAIKETLNIVEVIMPYIKYNNVMVQAGGNCGLIIRPFVDIFKTIYTFEPEPLNFYCLGLNLPYTNVVKIQSCLGNNHQLVKMDNSFINNSCGAFFVSNIKEEANIPMFKIDDLNLDQCDLILLDIEGYEQNALLGGEYTIKKFKPILCLEFYEPWMQRYSSSSHSILTLLYEWGYKQISEYRTSYSIDKIFSTNIL